MGRDGAVARVVAAPQTLAAAPLAPVPPAPVVSLALGASLAISTLVPPRVGCLRDAMKFDEEEGETLDDG